LKAVTRGRPLRALLDELAAELGADRVERDAPLAALTTFRVGGPADALYRARTGDELMAAVSLAHRMDIPCFLLGKGANILVGDRGFRGLVVRCEIGGTEQGHLHGEHRLEVPVSARYDCKTLLWGLAAQVASFQPVKEFSVHTRERVRSVHLVLLNTR
jgi:UDP-N-acetylenolpyruvoylglucosamine reductase